MNFLKNIFSASTPLLRGEDFAASDKGRSLQNQGCVKSNLYKKTTLLFFFIINLTLFSQAQQNENTRLKHYSIDDNHVALSGYDPLTYFANKPTPGNENIAYTYKGLTYYFVSEKSRGYFKANPEKYEPAYGGWCAYALAKKKPEKMEADPETFKIIDGKLYVFYNSFGINTIKKWNKDEPKSLTTADKNWNIILSE